MSETGHVEERLGPYLDGELDATERQGVAAHLERCASCREALEQWQALQARMRASEAPDPGPAYWERFAERVEARLAEAPHPAREAASRVGWMRRGLRGLWPRERFAWGRLAGAVAVLALLTYVGVRSFVLQERSIQAPRRAPTPQHPAPAESLAPVSLPRGAAKEETGESVSKNVVQAPPSLLGATGVSSKQEHAWPKLQPVSNGAAGGVSSDADQVPAGESPGQVMKTRPSPPSEVPEGKEAPTAMPQAIRHSAEQMDHQAFELEMHHPREEALEETRRFVVAALASEVPTAQGLREDLQRIAPADTMRLRAMDTWLGAATPTSGFLKGLDRLAAPKPQPDPLLALDALVWPQRHEEAWREVFTQLARRLVDAAPRSEALQERAVAYARFLVQESRDEASRAEWRRRLERIEP